MPFDLGSLRVSWQQLGPQVGHFEFVALITRWFSSLEHFSALRIAFQFTILVGLFTAWRSYPTLRAKVWLGVWCGLPILFLAAILQKLAIYDFSIFSDLVPPLSGFWRSQYRISGTLTDPNALGVVSALLFPMVLCSWRSSSIIVRFLRILALLGLSACGLAAGSRSFIAAIVVISLIFAWRQQRRALQVGSALILLVVLGWNIALVFTPALLGDLIAVTPTNLARILETFSWPTMTQALSSRLVFLRIGLETWQQSPVLGVGLGQFSNHVLSSSAALGIDLGGWRDNANNFYLGVLSETGVLGVLALGASVLRLQVSIAKSPRKIAAGVSLAAFAFILLFGPHLEFAEVSILIALLMAEVLEVRQQSFDRLMFISLFCTATTAFLIYIQVASSSWGLFGVEREGERNFRWTARTAQLVVPCNSDQLTRVAIKAIFPQRLGREQAVSLTYQNEVSRLVFRPHQEQIAEFRCSPGARSEILRIEILNPWIPRAFGMGRDTRILGVQIIQEG